MTEPKFKRGDRVQYEGYYVGSGVFTVDADAPEYDEEEGWVYSGETDSGLFVIIWESEIVGLANAR